MIVYHGSNSNFNRLKISKKLVKNESTLLNEGYGIYFSLDKNVAMSYGKFLYTLEINNKYIRNYKTLNSCKKLVKNILDEVENITKKSIKKYIDVNAIANNLFKVNLGFNNLGKELELILDNNFNFYNNYSNSVRNNIYRKIRITIKKTLKAYIFNYHISNIGIIKDVNPEIVKIINKEKIL